MADKKRVIILGADGYIGWALYLRLLEQGHDVWGVDNLMRRATDCELGHHSLTPLAEPRARFGHAVGSKRVAFEDRWRFFDVADTGGCGKLKGLFFVARPDVVVNLAQQPSAPYSMMDSMRAIRTLKNTAGLVNLLFALRDHKKETGDGVQLVQMGTSGVYGAPPFDCPEGYQEWTTDGKHIETLERHNALPDEVYPYQKDGQFFKSVKFPVGQRVGSFYHGTKSFDAIYCDMAARFWNIPITILHQGVVYGVSTAETRREGCATRFNFDDVMGTCINRFMAAAAFDAPLPIYHGGKAVMPFIHLEDTMRCIEIAMQNPTEGGGIPRVFNQISEYKKVRETADDVMDAAKEIGLSPTEAHYDPRLGERVSDTWHMAPTGLKSLGFVPTKMTVPLLADMLTELQRYKNRFEPTWLEPTVKWQGA